MNPALEEAIKEAFAMAPSNVAYVHTLEIRHPSMSEPLYLVQGFFHRECGVDGVMKTFRACAFDFTLPPVDDSGLSEMGVKIDNTNNRVSDFCETAMNFPAPIELFYRPYLSTDLSTPQMDPPLHLFLLNITVSDTLVTGRAVPQDFLNGKFPSQVYDSTTFPRL